MGGSAPTFRRLHMGGDANPPALKRNCELRKQSRRTPHLPVWSIRVRIHGASAHPGRAGIIRNLQCTKGAAAAGVTPISPTFLWETDEILRRWILFLRGRRNHQRGRPVRNHLAWSTRACPKARRIPAFNITGGRSRPRIPYDGCSRACDSANVTQIPPRRNFARNPQE